MKSKRVIRTPEEQGLQAAALGEAWPYLLDVARGDGRGEIQEFADCPLWNLYAPVAAGNNGHPFVVGQLGQSLDGRVATITGNSQYISGPEGIRHLHRLRALVDAVVVGVGTVVTDDPQLTVREVDGHSPARVVIDPNFRLPSTARMITEGSQPVYAIQARGGVRPSGVEPIVIPCDERFLRPHDIVSALANLGFYRVLVEGGAWTVSLFLAAGALDRLHLSIAPVIIGAGPVGLNLPPIDQLTEALRPAAVTYQLGDDILFDCDLSSVR